MAKVKIIVGGKPVEVEETTPGLFGQLGYQYAGGSSTPSVSSGGSTTTPTPTTTTQQPAQTTIMVGGKPTQVTETTPGLFGNLGYEYADTTTTTNPNQAQIDKLKQEVLDIQQVVEAADKAGYAGTGKDITTDASGNIVPASEVISPTGDETLDGILQEFKTYLSDLLKAGNKVNPNVVIDSATAQSFIDQAASQINPYYQSQINSIKQELTQSLDDAVKAYDLQQQEMNESFRRNLGIQRENEVSSGTVYSGRRALRENALRDATSRSLEGLANKATQGARDMLQQTERTIGSSNISGITPSVTQYTASLAGKGGLTPQTTRSLTGVGGVTGSLEREQEEQRASRERLLRSAYINKELTK